MRSNATICLLIAGLAVITMSADAAVKWSQPPAYNPASPYPTCYWGWDEISLFEFGPIIADDWLCEDERPVTDIHWWGSYQNWDLPGPPPVTPVAFHLGIWTDIPAGVTDPFSHPGQLIWEFFVPYPAVEEIPVGCDFHPDYFYDTCFHYSVYLDPSTYFYQGPGPTVYWLSISAIYDFLPADNLWGWKTREHFFNDDAIRIFDPIAPALGSQYVSGIPIEDMGGDSWDMAFELTTLDEPTATPTEPAPPTVTPTDTPTEPPPPTVTPTPLPQNVKWSQPPRFNPASPYPGCYWGWDEMSLYDFGPVVADDWLCEDDRPVTDIHWWGSYQNWDIMEPPPNPPMGFHLGIWTDIPAGVTDPWSHPGQLIWEYFVPYPDVMEMPVGCDYHPDYFYDTCFEYTCILPPAEYFYQTPGPTVYWVSISALYMEPPLMNPWGWKTREHFFNDDAVRIFAPVPPTLGSQYAAGEPIENPQGISWDMAFELTSELAATPTPTSTNTPVPPSATPTWTPVPPTDTPTATPTEPPPPTPTPTGLPPDVKWSQPPQYNAASPFPSCYWGWDEVSLYYFGPVAADDWLCQDDRPVTDIHWWGSYHEWDLIEPPAVGPDLFHIGIWTDIPAGVTDPWSHPGDMVWEYIVPRAEVQEMPVGCDYFPGYTVDTCYRYDLILPPQAYFYQTPGPTVYWLSICAIYADMPQMYPWGWKTREHFFNDAAIRIYDPTAPMLGSQYVTGIPIENPQGVPWDMSFELTSILMPTPTPTPADTPTPRPLPAMDTGGLAILLVVISLILGAGLLRFRE